MQTIFIASGDSLHGDAAAVHRVLELLGQPPNVLMHAVPRLTETLAAEIAAARDVVFIHPERQLGEPWVEPATPHSVDDSQPLDAGGLISLARALYQFNGNAYVCRVPGLDFRKGRSLSPYAESRARQAANLLRRFIGMPQKAEAAG